MKQTYNTLWTVLCLIIGSKAFSCATEYKENEADILISRRVAIQPIKKTKEETIKEFNAAFGDGFGDYVFHSAPRSVNISLIKSYLSSGMEDPLFFRSFCYQKYGVNPQLSERMRRTLLAEHGITEIESVGISSSSSSKDITIDKGKKDA